MKTKSSVGSSKYSMFSGKMKKLTRKNLSQPHEANKEMLIWLLEVIDFCPPT